MATVGIDLGTCTSAIAIYRRGRLSTLRVEGSSTMPSCVCVKPDAGLLVGESAKRRALIDPERSVTAIKRQMGNRDFSVELDGKSYSPVDISSLILEKLVAAASKELNEPIKDAVISVPAYFNNNQKEDTRLAGEKAGLNVLRLIPEPTAAAIAYGLDKDRDQTILVYDLGGGTFDVSILRVCGNKFTVVGIGGDHDLGGEDFDRRLIDLIIDHLRRDPEMGGRLADLDAGAMQQKLKESAEAAKKELSSADTVEIEIPDLLAGRMFFMKLQRPEYEAATKDLVDRSIKITLQTIKDAKLSPDDIDRVVLVGGSTYMPIIQQTIAKEICDPYIAENVDEVVSHGAAIMAFNLSALEEDRGDMAPIEVTNITAHSLGIRADKDKFATLIPRGTSLPAEARKSFTTARNNADRTDVVVFQGEEQTCSDNEQIGGFALTGIRRAPAGKPRIDVEFKIDDNDILTVNATEAGSGKSGEIIIEKFEPQPYDPAADGAEVKLESLRIGVSPTGCDDAGAILRRLGLKYKEVQNRQFRQKKVVDQFDVLFINCLCDSGQLWGDGIFCSAKKNLKALRDFVARGGVLYVSDYAFENITRIFPGKISFGGRSGGGGRFTASVVDPEVRELIGPSATVEFGPAYVTVKSVDGSCKVYMKKGNEPVLVSFPYEEGHVVYTSFHNAASIDESIARVVGCVILQTMSLATNTPLVELVESTNLHKM